MARPSKLTPDAQKRIVQAIKQGATYEHAAAFGGIHYDTFNNWMRRGEKSKRGKYFEFFEAIKKAEADAVVKWLAVIDKAGMDGNWQAMAWKLERRYPHIYGRHVQQVEHSGEVVSMTVDEWREERERRRKEALEALKEFDND